MRFETAVVTDTFFVKILLSAKCHEKEAQVASQTFNIIRATQDNPFAREMIADLLPRKEYIMPVSSYAIFFWVSGLTMAKCNFWHLKFYKKFGSI